MTTGQQIDVSLGSQLGLYFVPSSGPAYVVDTDTAPVSCGTTITNPPTSERGLTVVKSVSPTGPSAVGATLTYSLDRDRHGQRGADRTSRSPTCCRATGPARLRARRRTSGARPPARAPAPAPPAYDPATHRVTWSLGTLPAGTSRTVSFQVTIDRPASTGGTIPGFDVVNVGVVGSDRVPPVTSNRVVTPVSAVEGVKVGRPDTGSSPGSVVKVLPHTGPGVRLGVALGVAVLLLLAGLGLMSLPVARRRG